mgnify:CR=1 FL=1
MTGGRYHGSPRLLATFLVILCASAVFIRLFGLATLLPWNTAWMIFGDPGQHYLGWAFYRGEDWHWPPGRIETMGLPLGTSIGLTDAIPLLALLFKPLNAWLPGNFQYFGLWMLVCYVLNGYFGLRLVARLTDHGLLQALGAAFFVLSPPLMLRGYGHEALMAHWLLLAAIETCLGDWRWRRWLLLNALAALIHPYLLVMVFGILVAHATAVIRANEEQPFKMLGQIIGFIAVDLSLLWFAGYFVGSGSLAAEGYGFFSMNILAFFDPLLRWSRFLKPMPVGTEGQYEGFLYLGAGAILLMALAIGVQLLQPVQPPRRHIPLIVVSIVFWLLALSNVVTLGSIELFVIPLPDQLLELLSIFRASGRFGWIAFYLLNFAILVPILYRLPTRRAVLVLLGALALQLADFWPKYNEFRQFIRSRHQWTTPLASTDWVEYAKQAKRLLLIPPHPPLEGVYLPFAHLAASHGLATNAAHLSRSAPTASAFSLGIADELVSGKRDPRTIYVFHGLDTVRQLPLSLQAEIQPLDGLFILPPMNEKES